LKLLQASLLVLIETITSITIVTHWNYYKHHY